MHAATSLHGSDRGRQLMTASRRSPRLNAAHRRRSPSSGEERAHTIGQIALPDRVLRHPHQPRNDGLAALRYRNLTTRILPDGRTARTPSGQAPILNPHRLATGAAPTYHAGPRFPPPRLLGRLPPEHVASFFSGRRPRSLHESCHLGPRLVRP